MSQETQAYRGRGRPRPVEAIERDSQILSLLSEQPMTRNELCELTGLHTSIVYLSLSRLRLQGKTKLCQGRAGDRLWTTDVGGPCP